MAVIMVMAGLFRRKARYPDKSQARSGERRHDGAGYPHVEGPGAQERGAGDQRRGRRGKGGKTPRIAQGQGDAQVGQGGKEENQSRRGLIGHDQEGAAAPDRTREQQQQAQVRACLGQRCAPQRARKTADVQADHGDDTQQHQRGPGKSALQPGPARRRGPYQGEGTRQH
jgi:hypothetical protein